MMKGSPCTDLEAVLVGFQDGVHLRGRQDVVVERRGRLVATSCLVCVPRVRRASQGRKGWDGANMGLVVLAW